MKTNNENKETQKDKYILQSANNVKPKPKKKVVNKKKVIELTPEEKARNEILNIFKRKHKEKKENNDTEEKNMERLLLFEKTKQDFKVKFTKVGLFLKRYGIFLACCFLLVFTIINVTIHMVGTNTFKNYDDYKSSQIDYRHILDMNYSNSYYVYMYSNSCHVCSNIKKDIFQYLESNKNKNDNEHGKFKLYLFCVDDDLEKIYAEEGEENINGVTDHEDLKFSSVPMLIYVNGQDHEITNYWDTGDAILKQLSL